MVTRRGTEATALKIKAILDMKAPTNVNEVQKLMGRVATLGYFISKVVEKSLPFFKVHRNAKTFEWDTSCQQAFEELKKHLAGLPLLLKPIQGDTSTYISQPSPKLLALSFFEKKGGNKCQVTMLVKYSMEQKDGTLLSRN
ncbi:UNVERIFIED_CONTAM: hypothetical protein Sangu_3241100 [Sesamum angustifolium]|uniref:Reverse transcriptase/retrotransposon-derived protein RNase H-like domain-containing protein n=1 Tax=Sesamum angustifolium TaxID=2727405 RepID=A0AAW2JG66_9LAMI